MNNNFASIYTLNSQAIGFEFEQEADLASLERLFDNETEIITNRNDDYSMSYLNDVNSHNTLINSEKEIYFLCCLETKLDKATKRGAILKSICIGTTKLINLNVFKSLAKYLLDEIFKIHTFNVNNEEKHNLNKKLIELAYKSFNNLPSK